MRPALRWSSVSECRLASCAYLSTISSRARPTFLSLKQGVLQPSELPHNARLASWGGLPRRLCGVAHGGAGHPAAQRPGWKEANAHVQPPNSPQSPQPISRAQHFARSAEGLRGSRAGTVPRRPGPCSVRPLRVPSAAATLAPPDPAAHSCCRRRKAPRKRWFSTPGSDPMFMARSISSVSRSTCAPERR